MQTSVKLHSVSPKTSFSGKSRQWFFVSLLPHSPPQYGASRTTKQNQLSLAPSPFSFTLPASPAKPFSQALNLGHAAPGGHTG